MSRQRPGSPRQQRTRESMERVYAFIQAYIADKDIPPSIEDIATGVYLSRGGVLRHLDRLEGMGRLSREPGIPRSIRLLGKSDE